MTGVRQHTGDGEAQSDPAGKRLKLAKTHKYNADTETVTYAAPNTTNNNLQEPKELPKEPDKTKLGRLKEKPM